MLVLNQEIIVILLHITCGVCFGIMKSLVDFLRLIGKRLVYRAVIDIFFVCISGALFIYIMYVTTDFDIKFVDAMLIFLGYGIYCMGPLQMLKKIKEAVLLQVKNMKSSRIFRYISK